jgi:anaerobic magnesium-protoporphyrin IX monomethyl ester cyclase
VGNRDKKVLLLNPPGRRIYLRDYYCSHASKARYYWGPFDLIVLSGQLDADGDFDLTVLDAMHERLAPDACVRRVLEIAPDAILFLTGAVSFTEDFALLEMIAEASPKQITMVGTGDCLLAEAAQFFEAYPQLDAAILDFTWNDAAAYLRGEAGEKRNLAMRRSDGTVDLGRRTQSKESLSLPMPRYDLFPIKEYRIPHGRRMPFAGILTDYGCPFRCDYCIGGELGFRLRDLDNVIEEMRELRRLGVRELWIKDLTFGVQKKRTFELLELMRRERFGFTWVCLSRANVLTAELLREMRAAGCHTIQLGVESADEALLERHTKGISPDQVRKVVAMCKNEGIRVLAHYILGLPGDTTESIRRTIRFAIELDTAFASFNVAMPRMGTEFRQTAIEEGLIDGGLEQLDNSISQPVYETPELSREALWGLRNEAIRAYHLRPGYMLRRLFSVRSLYEFTTLFREGFALLFSTRK